MESIKAIWSMASSSSAGGCVRSGPSLLLEDIA
jgi:hypothetical protein